MAVYRWRCIVGGFLGLPFLPRAGAPAGPRKKNAALAGPQAGVAGYRRAVAGGLPVTTVPLSMYDVGG
jgi:hypothetical protein